VNGAGGEFVDIETSIGKFMGDRKPDRRYTSFDYCFNYFQAYREQGRTADLSARHNMQLSCLQLGFYLASWGMFRASSQLPSRSLTQFEPLIEVIAAAPAQAWEIDAHCYSPRNVALLTDLGQRIGSVFPHPVTLTLITKIMLGVFGSVPALDQFVVKGMRKEGLSATFSAGMLGQLSSFYEANADVIDRHRAATYDFESGQPGTRTYSRAKVIDMIFFIHGGGRGSRF
jgi:hypothetical protein